MMRKCSTEVRNEPTNAMKSLGDMYDGTASTHITMGGGMEMACSPSGWDGAVEVLSFFVPSVVRTGAAGTICTGSCGGALASLLLATQYPFVRVSVPAKWVRNPRCSR